MMGFLRTVVFRSAHPRTRRDRSHVCCWLANTLLVALSLTFFLDVDTAHSQSNRGTCPADLDNDGDVDGADLSPLFTTAQGIDLDGSGEIDTSDTAFILGAQDSSGACSSEIPGGGISHSINENIISNDAVLGDAMLSDARSFDLIANITNDDWLVSQVDIQVIHPNFILYQEPTRGRIFPPNPFFYEAHKELKFDSFLSAPTFDETPETGSLILVEVPTTDILAEDSETRLRGDIFKSLPPIREGTLSGPIARFTIVGDDVADINIRTAPLAGELIIAVIEGHSHVESDRVTKVPFSFVAAVPCDDMIHVPSEIPTVQESIDAVCAGGTVMIAPGDPYLESINFNGKAVTLDLPLGVRIESATAINISDGSVIKGAGTIMAPLVASAGTIAPDPGETLTIEGNYIQHFDGNDGDLVIDLADGLAPTMLEVTGTATLHGRLRVMADPGVDPDVGFPFDCSPAENCPPFTVLSAGNIPIGSQFDFPVVPYLDTDRLFTIVSGTMSVTLQVVSLSRDVMIEEQPGAGLSNPDDPKAISPTGIPRAATLADIDGDLKLDLLIALPHLNDPLGTDGVVVILYNDDDNDPDNGWGGFKADTVVVNVGIGANPSGIAVDLIDEDNLPDIVVSNEADNTVSVLFVSDGSLEAFDATPFTTMPLFVGIAPTDVAVADLDGDMFNDIATPNSGSDSVSIFWGGAGIGDAWAVEEVPEIEDPECASSIEPGDFDAGIHRLSFLATTHTATNSVGLIVVNTDRTFDLLPSLAVDTGPFDLVIADFNLDGNDDIAAANGTGSSVNILLNTSMGSALTFDDPSSLPLPAPPISIAAGNLDADADADIDLAVIAGGAVQILRNDLDLDDRTILGFTAYPDQNAGVNPLIIRSGDVNNDRGDDLITVSETTAARGVVSEPVNILVTAPACDGDFDFDRDVDLADLQLMLFNFGETTLVGDMNDDNIVDLADLQILLFNFGNECP